MSHHLVGATEVAGILGVTRQRVHQLAMASGFPRPEAELSAGNIWNREEIDRWVEAHRDQFSGPKPILCSFCGRRKIDVRRLVSGPGGIEICNECIDLAAEIVLEECDGDGLTRVPAYFFRHGIGRSAP